MMIELHFVSILGEVNNSVKHSVCHPIGVGVSWEAGELLPPTLALIGALSPVLLLKWNSCVSSITHLGWINRALP